MGACCHGRDSRTSQSIDKRLLELFKRGQQVSQPNKEEQGITMKPRIDLAGVVLLLVAVSTSVSALGGEPNVLEHLIAGV